MRYLFIVLFSFSLFSQQTKKVDFISCDAFVQPNFSEKSISGKVSYEFKVLEAIDTIRIDAIAMGIDEVLLNSKKVNYKNSGKALLLFEGFIKGNNTLSFTYEAKPKQTLYFTGEEEDLQIWTQGQGKNTSHWLPSFDDVNEKVIFNVTIGFEKSFQVISNGKLDKIVSVATDMYYWHYQMQKPMSSYLLMLAIGNFEKQTTTTKSGTTLEFYLDKKDRDKFETTYRFSKQIFDYLEQEIGVKYPWEVYRQVPVRDFLYAGMENTTSTIFSQDFVVDSIGFNDKNYINVNAHELAHQWFGDLITAKESKHHWLHEGFATYYALLAEKEVFGDDYFYNQLYQSALELKQANTYDSIPILNEKASSLTFYKKGAWALHVLRENVGEKNFRKAVKNYLDKYAFKNVDTDDFLNEINKVSKYDTNAFKKSWLESPTFNLEEAMSHLVKNNSIKQLIDFGLTNKNLEEDKLFEKFKSIIKSDVYFTVKQEIVYQSQNLSDENQLAILKVALETKDIKVRQAVAEILAKIPQSFKADFETLLLDPSYITREIALFRLWTNFEQDRERLVAISEDWMGLNYNLKIAHLTLKIVGSNANEDRRQKAVKELERYIKLPYEASVREPALETLIKLGKISDVVLEELINASLHHKWQFVKFAKDNIRALISNDTIREKFILLKDKVNDQQKERINYFLKETE
ncbi:M1 family metallopeptidase [Flavobacterium jejuense]|uniref:Aminopeptidase N n=1 Tax=Flavobacterium jejuense TaxID=1544455 RepID=A0ABX0ILM8_9FLAO|nr:M1 family metallopeptidase [Flavobacterium jejuense]NHN24498.1 M1 family metallopeptidase [Flavobacterium jejuense]